MAPVVPKIAAAMTNGDVDNLMVGRNGVFYDRKGEVWDATVTRVVNLPMLVQLSRVRRTKDLADAVRDAQEAGRKYINVASQLLADRE